MDHPHSSDLPGARCLRWDAAGARLCWADPGVNALLSRRTGDNAIARHALPDAPYLVAPCASGRLLIGMAKRLCLAEAQPGTRLRAPLVRTLASVDPADRRTVIGGGRTDRAGNLVFGTCNTAPAARAIGSFYQFSRQHGLRRLALPTVVSAAAVCFNVAGDRLYFADARGEGLWQCDYDPLQAAVCRVRPFAGSGAASVLDALVDRDDRVWTLQAGTLVRHGADGAPRVLARLEAGAASIAFAGTAFDTLAVLGVDGKVHMPVPDGVRGIADTPFDDLRYSEDDLKRQPNPAPPAASTAPGSQP